MSVSEVKPVFSKTYLQMLKESGISELVLPEGTTESSAAPPASDPAGAWRRLRSQVLACQKCGELARTRHSVVFGSGNERAQLVFIGEAPGGEEDRQGLPFVGPAGQLLTKMIEAINLKREEVYIANVLKCRPPGNRTPKPEEIQNCETYLTTQLSLIRPRLICALGTFAAHTLLKTSVPISALRGRCHDYLGIPVICTFHPAYLLRNPAEKRKAWEDLKKVKSLLFKEPDE